MSKKDAPMCPKCRSEDVALVDKHDQQLGLNVSEESATTIYAYKCGKCGLSFTRTVKCESRREAPPKKGDGAKRR